MNNKEFKYINSIGLLTFYTKEVKRFLTIPKQTLIAPMINMLLLLFIFSVSIGEQNSGIKEISYLEFLIPGLVMMKIMQNCYASTATAIVSGKVTRSIYDVLTIPLSNNEILLGYVLSSLTRGVIIAILSFIIIYFFVDFNIFSLFYTITFIFLASVCFGLIGIITGILSNSWEETATINSYLITPLSFLSGTFFSIQKIPEAIQFIAYLNPFLYLINGLRYGVTGYADSLDHKFALYLTILICIVLLAITKFLLHKSWNLRS